MYSRCLHSIGNNDEKEKFLIGEMKHLIEEKNDMKSRIENWYVHDNGHPNDHAEFYGIVIDSIGNKIDKSVFESAIDDVNKADEVYKRYEDLRDCLIEYRKRLQGNGAAKIY